jgi:hypothetical protein
MASTPEMAAHQAAVVDRALQDVISAAETYAKLSVQNAGATSLSEVGEVSQSQIDLIASVRVLDRTVRGPVTMLFSHLENVSIFPRCAVRCCGPDR